MQITKKHVDIELEGADSKGYMDGYYYIIENQVRFLACTAERNKKCSIH